LVDTSCDLPDVYVDDYNIDTIPMTFSLDETEHPGGNWRDISPKDYYGALKAGGVAKTAQINPGTYAEVFKQYAERGTDLICIVLSSGLSGSYDSAVNAALEVTAQYPDRTIIPVDSVNATGGHGMLTLLAAKKAEEGASASETADWLNEIKHRVLAMFTVDDLNFLHRGGRLSKLSAVAGSLLGVKPLLNIAPDGSLRLKDKVRGRKTAIETLVSQMKRCAKEGGSLDNVMITHCDCEDDANKCADLVKSAFEVKTVDVMMMGPVIGAHTGPGAIAAFILSDIARTEYEEKYYPQKQG